jgi:hypothetical protein
MSDIRRIVGSVVHAKAIHVTNEAECGRRYGRNKSTKLVQGHVSEVHSVKLGPPLSAANSEIPAQNSEINAADATEAAAANLKDAVNATINPNVSTAPAAPSNYNYPTATTTTFDASLSLPTPSVVAA